MTRELNADLRRPHKIVILNPKGGCGKTTLATNLASYFALEEASPSTDPRADDWQPHPPTLVDCDPGGYSMRWVEKRPADRPTVYGIAAYEHSGQNARPLSAWPGSRQLIVDLPASLAPKEFFHQTYDADSILIPVVPSEIDTYSAAKFIADLLLVAQFDRRNRSLAIVANRTKHYTKSYRMLMRFLRSLEIPVVTELRDSQNYVRAAAEGVGIVELPAWQVKKDIEQLEPMFNWLDRWRTRRLDGLIAEELERKPEREVTGSRLSYTH